MERAEAPCGPVLGLFPPIKRGDPGDPTDILRLWINLQLCKCQCLTLLSFDSQPSLFPGTYTNSGLKFCHNLFTCLPAPWLLYNLSCQIYLPQVVLWLNNSLAQDLEISGSFKCCPPISPHPPELLGLERRLWPWRGWVNGEGSCLPLPIPTSTPSSSVFIWLDVKLPWKKN